MSQYIPSTAMISDPPATDSGSATQPGRPDTRWENAARLPRNWMRPLRCAAIIARNSPVTIIATIVPMTTWSVAPPPAGGALPLPCAIAAPGVSRAMTAAPVRAVVPPRTLLLTATPPVPVLRQSSCPHPVA